jgi:hypothetical protein
METVELRLTGAALLTIADNDHMPGWPGRVSADLVDDDDADRDLNRAAARWYTASTSRRVGARGTVVTGPATPTEVSTILDYLESVAGALEASSDPDARAEARAVRHALDGAVTHLRRAGVPVVEARQGLFINYVIG